MPAPDPSVRAASRAPATVRRRGAADAEPRWAALWRELTRTRERLAERGRRASAVEGLFRTSIEPRERLLTLGAARVTEALIEHYERSALERAERSLLGLWVNENLESLADHPYAPAGPVARLVERWRASLCGDGDAAAQAPDAAAQEYRTVPARLSPQARERAERDAISRYLGALFERGVAGGGGGDFGGGPGGRGSERRAPDPANPGPEAGPSAGGRSASGGPGADAPDGGDPAAGAGPDARAGPGAAGAPPGNGARSAAGSRTDRDPAAGPIEPLFRRLARALHPDREPDPAAREIKHVLMSTALAARRARDLDTLLALHVEHVGALPDTLDGAGAEALADALERQLASVRRALERASREGPAQELLTRYDGADDAERARRVAAHAERLDAETARLDRLADALASPEGLTDALDDRREIERDRLSIDELTGG